MFTWAGLILGFGFGWFRAGKRGGKSADKWQYAIAHAILFALAAFLFSLMALRAGLLPPSPVD